MGLDDAVVVEDSVCGGAGGGKFTVVSCSICLELVTDIGERSWAKLQCGHEFHLDCIGSAFNIKGAMQCPNCRKIEDGQWLFATGCRSFPDIMEDWTHDEDFYDLSYSEMLGLQWCPLPAFSRLPSFEEVDYPSTAYHDLMGQHAVFADHTAVSSSTHQCPYAAYYGPLHSSSSSSTGSVSDAPNFSNLWSGPFGPSEIQTSYGFGAMDHHHQGWERHSMPFSIPGARLVGSDQPSAPPLNQRPSRSSSDSQRSGLFTHPFIASHSSGGRVGSSVTSSMVPPYPGSAARARDRVQALQAYFHPPSSSQPMRLPMMPPGPRRSSGQRGFSQVGPIPSSSDQAGGFYVFPSGTSSRSFSEVDNSLSNRFNGWERNPMASFQQSQAEADSTCSPHASLGGPSGFRQRHGSDRTQSQNRP